MVQRNGVSVALGDVCYLDNRWYITHAGLLRLARRKRCAGIKTTLEKYASDPLTNRWVFKATVYHTSHSKGFVGYGDADPSNTSPLVAAPKCGSPKQERSTELSEKPMGSGSARLKRWGGRPAHQVRPMIKRDQINRALRMVQTMVTRGCGTNSAY